ncbi:C3 and PZP-like alpha-2-macroglobulin domain-containing protein 8 [Antedon mediterranea]|uniref:C3 and PZP-like alpha-2-macroglobulin domain-containing protein 8 n=1 Tax=Antedon mediterranea TaxID=105859 RepID=UPI003AF4F216
MICKQYVTTTNNEYRFDNPILQVETTTRIEFSVVAKNDVHIALSSSPEVMTPMYEIVIGGWKNTKSVIRRCAQCDIEKEHKETGILSVDEFTKFWISFVNGSIRVGLVGSDLFMEWNDSNPLPVKYVGFSTWHGIEGTFQFCQ